MVQKGGESVWEYIERFHNLSLMCPEGLPLPMLLQICRHNFLDIVEVRKELSKSIPGKSLSRKQRKLRNQLKNLCPQCPRTSGESTIKGVMHPNLPSPMGKKWWQLGCLRKLHQSRRGATPATTRSSSFHRDNTPSKLNRWWPSSTCLIRVTNLSYWSSAPDSKCDFNCL